MNYEDDPDFGDLFKEEAPKPKRERELTFNERIYVEEFIATGVKAEAARIAGFANPPSNAVVEKEIQNRQEYYLQTLEGKTRNILNEYARVAFLDPRKYFTETGDLRPVHQLDDETAAGLAALEVQTLGKDQGFATVTKIKFSPKLSALDSLSKTLGLFSADNERTVKSESTVTVQDNLTKNEKARRIAFVLAEALATQHNSETGD